MVMLGVGLSDAEACVSKLPRLGLQARSVCWAFFEMSFHCLFLGAGHAEGAA